MNRTILGLAMMAAVMGATVARADDCGPRPTYAPQGQSWNQGQYQLQTTQVWVPGQQTQVYVPGQCYQRGPFQMCSPGSYQTVVDQGHYVNEQTWVWVDSSYQPRPQQYGRQQYGRPYGRGNGRYGRGHRATFIDD